MRAAAKCDKVRGGAQPCALTEGPASEKEAGLCDGLPQGDILALMAFLKP